MVDYWYPIEAAAGAVRSVSTINKFGRNPDVDFGADEDLWGAGGNWTAPTIARVHDIASSSINDANGGSGAWTLSVQGLDAEYQLVSETVTLNGTTNVPTVNTYTRIFRMVVETGAGDNAGSITATAQTDATVTAQIEPGNNQTLMAIYTVPANHQAFVLNYYFGLDSVTVPGADSEARMNCKLLVRPNADESNRLYQTKHVRGVFAGGVSSFTHRFLVPLLVEGPADIKLRATDPAPSGLSNSVVTGGFDMLLRKI